MRLSEGLGRRNGMLSEQQIRMLLQSSENQLANIKKLPYAGTTYVCTISCLEGMITAYKLVLQEE